MFQVRPVPSPSLPPRRGGRDGTGLQVRALVRLICEAKSQGDGPQKKNEEIWNQNSGQEGQNFDSKFPAPHT